MARDNNPAPKSGELIPRGVPTPPVPVPTAKDRTIRRLLSMLSIWPFSNRAFAKSLETAQNVIDKQTRLEETLIQHGRTRGRLNDLDLTLEQDRLQRRREFIEERARLSNALNTSMLEEETVDQKNKLKKQELTIQQMEQKKRALQLTKELEELRKPSSPVPAQKKTRGRSEKQKLVEQAIKKYNKALERIEKMDLTAEHKETLRHTAEVEKEHELEEIEKMAQS